MQFAKTFYRYVVTSVAPATVALGGDSDPTTAYGTPGTPPAAPGTKAAANVDNILSCRIASSVGVEVKRIAVVVNGPSAAAASTGNLYVWDSGTQHWYLINASPVTLTQNEIAYFDAVSLCEGVVPVGATLGGADYKLVVIPNASPTTGQYAISMSPCLNVQ